MIHLGMDHRQNHLNISARLASVEMVATYCIVTMPRRSIFGLFDGGSLELLC